MSFDDGFISDPFFAIAGQAQMNAIREADKKREEERLHALELRSKRGESGSTMSELLKQLHGDPEEERKKLDEEMDRVNREAAAAVAAEKEKHGNVQLETKFPPPPTTGGR